MQNKETKRMLIDLEKSAINKLLLDNKTKSDTIPI